MPNEQRRFRVRLPLSALAVLLGSAMLFMARTPRSEGAAPPAGGAAYGQSNFQPPLLQLPDPSAAPTMDLPESIREKQKRELRKYRFKKMKEHGEELAKLAKSLQEDLDKSNENILSLKIVDKAQKIEKLAKKIQDEARNGT
jgi:hypothetical protein